MSAPNLILTNTIVGKTVLFPATSTMTAALANANGSNQVIKLNSVMYANANANNIPCYVEIQRGGISTNLAGGVTVPGYSSLVIVAKDTSTYLEEGDTLRCNTGGGGMSVTISYELIG